MCLLEKDKWERASGDRGDPLKDCRVTGSSPDLSDYGCGLFSVGHVGSFFLFPSFSNSGGWRGQRGADVSIAEALPLQHVLSVLPLQLTGQHRSVGHAVEKKAENNIQELVERNGHSSDNWHKNRQISVEV